MSKQDYLKVPPGIPKYNESNPNPVGSKPPGPSVHRREALR